MKLFLIDLHCFMKHLKFLSYFQQNVQTFVSLAPQMHIAMMGSLSVFVDTRNIGRCA